MCVCGKVNGYEGRAKLPPPPPSKTQNHTHTQAIEKIEFQVLFSLATIAMFHLHISIILPATGN